MTAAVAALQGQNGCRRLSSSLPRPSVDHSLVQPRKWTPFSLPLLQGLHIEDNELAGPLPLAPYLRTLRELLLDWQAALDSPEALRAATSLSRLVLSGHRAVDLHADGTLTVRPARDAEPLLAALAAMPALRLVEDIQGEVRWAVWQTQGVDGGGMLVVPQPRGEGKGRAAWLVFVAVLWPSASVIGVLGCFSLADALRHCTLPLSCTAGGCGDGARGVRHVAHGAATGAAGGCCRLVSVSLAAFLLHASVQLLHSVGVPLGLMSRRRTSDLHFVSPPQVALGAAHDSNLGWALTDVEAAETADAAQPA